MAFGFRSKEGMVNLLEDDLIDKIDEQDGNLLFFEQEDNPSRLTWIQRFPSGKRILRALD